MALTLPPEVSQRLCIIRLACVFSWTMEYVLLQLTNYRWRVKNGSLLVCCIIFSVCRNQRCISVSVANKDNTIYLALILVDGIGLCVLY